MHMEAESAMDESKGRPQMAAPLAENLSH